MPISFDDPFAAFADPFGARRPAQAPVVPSLTPEEEQSALGRIADAGLGGLSFLGGILDKPGRVVRGLLGGKPREALNIVPFSDALGITRPEDRVSGTDILGIDRATADQEGFFSPTGLGGFGVELLTDPLSYVSSGASALTKAGTLAKKAGILPGTTAGRLAGFAAGSPEATALANKAAQRGVQGIAGTERLGGHLGFGLPFGGNFGVADLGPVLDPLADIASKYPKGLGAALGGAVGGLSGAMDENGNPITGALGGAALGAGAGYLAPKLKPVLDTVNRGRRALFDPTVMGQWSAKGQEIAPEIYAARNLAKELSNANDALPALRAYAPDLLADPQGLRNILEGGTATTQGATDAAQIAKTQLTDALYKGRAAGLDIPELNNYLHRQVNRPELDVARQGVMAGTGAATSPYSAAQMSRVPFLEGIPGETASLERMVRDPRIGTAGRTAISNADAAAILTKDYGIPTAQQADHLAQFLYGLHPERKDIGLFSNHSFSDYASGIAGTRQATATADVIGNVIAREATNAESPGAKLVGDVLKDVGLVNFNHPYKDKFLPRETADALTHALKAYQTPQVLEPVVKFLDSFMAGLKGGLTSPFPSFNVRNLVSGAWQNYVLMGAKDIPESYRSAAKALRGETVDGIANTLFRGQGLTDQAATKKFADTVFSKGITGGGGVRDVPAAEMASDWLMRVPGLTPDRKTGLAAAVDYVKGIAPRSLEEANPLNIRGVGTRGESKFAPVAAGQKLGNEIEDMGRVAGMYGLMKQGYEPGTAAAMVKAGHIDYTHATAFERGVMKRLVPFYGWARNNIHEQFRQIMETPGGPAATSIKAANAANRGAFIPPYLGKGVTVPIGDDADGIQRYLSQLGLPYEDLGRLGLNDLAGNLHPLLKYGIEQATGRQMYSGRDLRDLHSRVADLVPGGVPEWLDNLLMSSPLSRLISTASTVVDPRKTAADKALNLGTGLKLTDVDSEKAKKAVVRDYINNNLRGPEVSRFETLSVRPENLPLLTPEEMRLYQLHLTQSRRPRPQNFPVGR